MPLTLPDDEPAQPADQAGSPLRFEASLNAALSAPMARNPDKAGFGFAVTYGAGWGEIPLSIGVDFMSLSSIGDASSNIDLTLADSTLAAERKVHTRLLHFEGWLRLQPAHWVVRPYAEGFIGAQLFQGKYVFSAGSQTSDVAQADDWVRSFGWGAGVEFLGILNRAGTMSLTLGVRRVYGASVKVSRPIVIANEHVQTSYVADTSVLLFMLGIGLHYELSDPHPNQNALGL